MKAVVQRVKRAAVLVESGERREIGAGLAVLFAAREGDDIGDAALLAEKTANLRIFADEDGKMNLSALETGGAVLVVSQFTLFADTKKGRRPSFIAAARPERAIPCYECYIEELKRAGIADVKTGVFGDDMELTIVNDGPVTVILDTDEWKR